MIYFSVSLVFISFCNLQFILSFHVNPLKHEIVRNSSIELLTTNKEWKFYLLNYMSHTIRYIPDQKTISILIGKINDIHSFVKEISRELQYQLNGYSIESDLELISLVDNSPDEIMRVELLSINLLQGLIIDNLFYLGEIHNPSLIEFRNRLIMASGWGSAGVHFKWLSSTDFQLDDNKFNFQEFQPLDRDLIGEDTRLFILNEETILVSYSSYIIYPNDTNGHIVRVGFAHISLNETSNSLKVSNIYPLIHVHGNIHRQHKNWCPFYYQPREHHTKILLFIERINPLTIVRVNIFEDAIDPLAVLSHGNEVFKKANSSLVSIAKLRDINWMYGELRGGTNALFIDSCDCYLSFFHSSSHIDSAFLKTYFFGAFTFSKYIPFQLLSISPYPIIHNSLYEGEWFKFKKQGIDYVNFPMNIYFKKNMSTSKLDIVLCLGHNDFYGYLATFQIETLLSSLVPLDNY